VLLTPSLQDSVPVSEPCTPDGSDLNETAPQVHHSLRAPALPVVAQSDLNSSDRPEPGELAT